MFATIDELLIAQASITALILAIASIFLLRQRLFRWTTAGFWAWAAFALYFVVNPLFSVWWNIDRYQTYLSVSGGLARGEWILIVVSVGIVAFFVSYLRSSSKPVIWKLPVEEYGYTSSSKLVLFLFIAISLYSLLAFRVGTFSIGRTVSFEAGRYTGQVTGYEHLGHVFMFVPVAMLLLSDSLRQRLLGWLLGSVYIGLSFSDAYGRYTLVAMFVAISIAGAVQGGRKWPRLVFFVGIFMLAITLQLRGHTSLNSAETFQEIVKTIPDQVGNFMASDDSAMLSTLYLESYIKDSITGYDYGLPFVNYSLFGFIPSRIFPNKYFLIDWLHNQQPAIASPYLQYLLYGAKSSLLGSFYGNGGLFVVILEMGLVGILCRKVDGMLSLQSPKLVKATAISWISLLWMIWGSADYWALTQLGAVSVPVIFLWFLLPKVEAGKSLPTVGAANSRRRYKANWNEKRLHL